MDDNMKILMLTNIPSPYMVDYLNELGKYCDLTAVFERDSSKSRDDSWRKWKSTSFRAVVLHGLNLGGRDSDTAICPQVIKYISREYDHIIVGNPCTPTGIIALTYMKLMHISYGFQSEGGFPGTGVGIKEKLKKYLFTGGEFYFSTASLGDEYYLLYGAEKDKIHRYPFTSLYANDILNVPVSVDEKKRLRRELGIPYEKMILSVGRFLECKGHDGLIKACKGLDKNVGIYIVGGTPTQEYLTLRQQLELENLHFVDFQNKENIKKYYMAADLFALNTRGDTWGLVINEAMSVGLPVVTTTNCYAALAMMGNENVNFIVRPDDTIALKNSITLLLDSYELRQRIGLDNISRSGWFTLENMGIVVSKELESIGEKRKGSGVL